MFVIPFSSAGTLHIATIGFVFQDGTIGMRQTRMKKLKSTSFYKHLVLRAQPEHYELARKRVCD